MSNTLYDDDDSVRNDYNWLSAACRGPTYTSYSQFSHLPNCAFDWGENGYAGSSNYGGGLLYLSAPSKFQGLIKARGHFATSLYASLSRSQLELGGPSSFGLELTRFDYAYDPIGAVQVRAPDHLLKGDLLGAKNGSSFRLGNMIDRGCFNYRWPVTEYYLDPHPNQYAVSLETARASSPEPSRGSHIGTCQVFSCAKDENFYQVLRIEEGGEPGMQFPSDSQVVLTIGGPIWFESFNVHTFEHGVGASTRHPFLPRHERDEKTIDASRGDSTDTIIYRDDSGRGMEAKLYQFEEGEYKPLLMIKSGWDDGPESEEGRTSTTAYNAVANVARSTRHGPRSEIKRSATFMAVFRLFEGHERERGKWAPKLPLSADLYAYIGVDPSSPHATGAMWKRVFLDQPTRSDVVLNLTEFDMIGRSLEKILQVDILPTFFDDGEDDSNKDYGVLVSNLFIHARIDLQSLFWKIRFLVRTHNFLSHLHKIKKAPVHGKGKELNSIEEFQVERIEIKVGSVIRYYAKALLAPAAEKPKTRMMPDSHIPGDFNYYYVLMTIWYVWQYFKGVPDWKPDWVAELATQQKRKPTLYDHNRLPSNNWNFASADKEKVHLLQWFHYGSLMKLCDNGVLPASWEDQGLREKVASLFESAKITSSAKLASREPYDADDELFDRLSFVSDELGIEGPESDSIGAIAWYSLERVKLRDFTRSLNPGVSPQDEEQSTTGPWEIYALCHHSRLVVITKEEEGEQDWTAEAKAQARIFKQRISSFLDSESTLTPSWERVHTRTSRSYLRSETTAVVASTFITMLEKALLGGSLISSAVPGADQIPAPTTAEQSQTDIHSPTKFDGPSNEQSAVMLSRMLQRQTEQSRQDYKTLLLEVLRLQSQMKTQADILENFRNERDFSPPIRWILFRLPPKYHPASFVTSLEATPELYEPLALSQVSLPLALRGHIRFPETLRTEGEKFTIRDVVEVMKLKCLSVFDITASGPEEDYEGFTWEIAEYRYSDSSHSTKDAEWLYAREQAQRFSWALYDNLVDQEVQHRLLSVVPRREPGKGTSLPQKLLELLVYVIHPESAICLGDYVLNLPRFSCQIKDTWVAFITLPSWRVEWEDVDSKRDRRAGSKSQGSTEFRLPPNLKLLWETVEGVGSGTTFKLNVSSIVLSTNGFGDFSKCTVLSELFGNHTGNMESVIYEARKLWQRFIHQPQTARCLVFLLLLGRLCQNFIEDYELAIAKLNSVLMVDNTNDYPDENMLESFRLELSYWSTGLLLKLQYTLNSIFPPIIEAKEHLMGQIREGPGKRSSTLEKSCQEYLGAFEESLTQLVAVNSQLEQRMKLNARNEAIFDTVSERRDRRRSIEQASTIEKLTYLTIAYLPVGLISAVYAIPGEHRVLFDDMGLQWFLWSILITSVATYILVGYIANVVEFLKCVWYFFIYPPPPRGGRWKKHRQTDPPNLWRWIGPHWDALTKWWHNKVWERNIPTPGLQSKPEVQGLDNAQKAMEEGKSKGIIVVTESVLINDDTRNGGVGRKNPKEEMSD